MKISILFIIAIFFGQSICDPVPPIWPDQWEQNFYDKWTFGDQKVNSQGQYIYDWINKKQNVYREDCQADVISRSFLNGEHTPCSQLVADGKRYFYMQEKNECCFCCDAAHGCDVLLPGWIQYAGEEWQGYEFIDGTFYNVFRNHDGPNLVYTLYNADTNIQSFIYRPGNGELMIYDQNSFSTKITDPSKLELPDVCKVDNVPRCGGRCDHLQPQQ